MVDNTSSKAKRLALIIDKHSSYISFQRDRVLSKWDISPTNTAKCSNIQNAPQGESLFGDAPTIVLQLENAAAVQELVKWLEQHNNLTGLSDTFPQGIIIETSVARTSTKKLEKLFSQESQAISWVTTSAEEKSIPQKLLDETNLSDTAREFLLNYVGDDFQQLLSIVDSVLENSPQLQKKIGIQNLSMLLPQKPGGVPPWDVETKLLAGNLSETIDAARRVHENSSMLVWLSVLKNKIHQYAITSQILSNNSKASDANIISALGLNNARGLYYVKKNARLASPDAWQNILANVITTEKNVKGGRSTDAETEGELLLIKLHYMLSSNK